MILVQSFKGGADIGFAEHCRKVLLLHQCDDPVQEFRIVRGFDDGHQPHRRFFQFDGKLRAGELRAVDDIGPVDKLIQAGILKSEPLFCHRSDEFRARLEPGIVKLSATAVPAEMLLVGF